MIEWEIVDSMQEAMVFVGMDGRLVHADSYGTTVDFSALDKWYEQQQFAKQQLVQARDYYQQNPNYSPPVKIAFAYLRRRLGI